MKLHTLPLFTGVLAGFSSVSATLLTPRTRTQTQPRSFEICAYVDDYLELNHQVYGKIDICLCIGDLDVFFSESATVKAALDNGHSIVDITAAITELIANCDKKATSCPAGSGPSYKKRSPVEIARTQRSCEWGLTKCGLQSHPAAAGRHWGSGATKVGSYEPYECIDTKMNLESCGGCVVPYTFGLSSSELAEMKATSKLGVDCTTMEGVSDVDCLQGRCVVHKCSKGYGFLRSVDANGADVESCVKSGELHQQVGGTIVWKKGIVA